MQATPLIPPSQRPGSASPVAVMDRLQGVLVRRVVAYAIDLAIIAVLWTVAATFLAGAILLSFGLLSPSFALLILVPGAYHVLTIGLQGATWGQRLCGLVVAGLNLEPPTLLQALVTTVVFYLTVPPSGGLALVAVFFLPHRRTLHDLLAGTIVLRRSDEGPR